MFRNYLVVALRNLRRHKGYAAINVVGLAVGLACFTLILLFVRHEQSYDRYHAQADRIYRLTLEVEASEGASHNAQTAPAWFQPLQDTYPEIQAAVRLKPPRQTWMVSYEDQRFAEKRWAFADPSVFEVFDIPLYAGDPETALQVPWQVVISRSAARKYFGPRDPVGATLTLDNQYDFVITGLFEDFPAASHIHFDFLASFDSMRDPGQLYLMNVPEAPFPFVYTYLLLDEGVDPAALQAKLPAFLSSQVPPQFRQGNTLTAGLQPLTDIHLHSQLENEIEANGDAGLVYLFFAIGVFILLIACINFMNLATARATGRAKEVGMRKVVGAHRGHLMQQFLGESVMMALLALAVALVLVGFALSPFNTLTGQALGPAELFAPGFLLLLLGATLLTGVVAGSYPALFLSAFRPAAVLKGASHSTTGGQGWLRQGLIVFQFSISIALIISTMVVYRQLGFMQGKPLGFDKEQVVVVELTDPTPSSRFPALREAFLRHASVQQVAGAQSVPAGLVQQARVRPVGAGDDETWQVQFYAQGYDYVETMGMTMAAGRDFSRDFPADTLSGVVLNETAAQAFGWKMPDDALGQEITFAGGNGPPLRVIGVVKDFHTHSVRERIAPTVMLYNSFRFYALVRLAPGDLTTTIEALRQDWARVLPGYTFDYSFLDDNFDQLYRAESVLGTLLGTFALLTILIACLGLFGLAAYMTARRTKEIGVRKVMGATTSQIVLLLSREVTLLVAVAFVLAGGAAYLAMDRWLAGFAYHIAVPWPAFVLAGAAAFGIAWLTVGYQALRAASLDPARSLKQE